MIAVERPSAALMQKVHEPLGVVTLPSLPALAAPALPYPSVVAQPRLPVDRRPGPFAQRRRPALRPMQDGTTECAIGAYVVRS